MSTLQKIIKLSSGDIVIGTVLEENGKRIMKNPWEYVNLADLMNPKYIVAPYQMFLFGEGKEVHDLEIKDSQIVYEKNLSTVPFIKDMYFSKSMEKSGILV